MLARRWTSSDRREAAAVGGAVRRNRTRGRRRLGGLAALSYGVVVRWPPAVAHSGTGLSRPLALSIAQPSAAPKPHAVSAETSGEIWTAVNHLLWNLPRAREACRRPTAAAPAAPAATSFFEISFLRIAVGGDTLARAMDFERSARTLLRSAAPCGERSGRRRLARTGRAELRGRCSLAAGCCAQRHWAHLTSLAQRAPEQHAEPSGEIGHALTSSLRFSARARSAPPADCSGTCRTGRHFLFAKFLFAKLLLARYGRRRCSAIRADAAAVGGAMRRTAPAVGAGWEDWPR